MSSSVRPLVAGVALLFCLSSALARPVDNAASRSLHALIAEQWQYELRHAPELATGLGDYRYNDRWADHSLAGIAARRAAAARYLGRFEAIPAAALDDADRLNRELMIRGLKTRLESIDLKLPEMPVSQIEGAHIDLPGQIASMPFATAHQYAQYLARLHGVAKVLADTEGVMRRGRADGLMPPRYLLDKVVVQCRAIESAAGAANPFAVPLAQLPASIPPAERARLTAAIIKAIDTEVRPAYARFAEFVALDYAPYGRSEPGLWALPDGDRLYAFKVREQTTTNLTPAEIHALGLREVARIEQQMSGIATLLGFADLAALRAAVDGDPQLHAQSREQIVELYRGYIEAIRPHLPELFGALPGLPVEVRAVESFREQDAAGAEYQQVAPDGSRPGIVFVNTSDYAARDTVTIEATAYHEGLPGHHLQAEVALGQARLPPFRQNADYNAYAEGWGLYAEDLGKELGLYQDPYSDYGRLVCELLRADRLVVDTGVHYKHWSRAQVIDYLHAHPPGDEPTIESEADRYIAWPAQALAYKIGELKFLELRARARAVAGPRFDIRSFHAQMLGGGPLPLDVLEVRFEVWLGSTLQRNGSPGAAAGVVTP